MSSSATRPLRSQRVRAKKTVKITPTAGVQPRSSAYRGLSREQATAAYHADALVMARMGFVPTSEEWTTDQQQVLVVDYVHAPDQTPAVLEALAQVVHDPIVERPALPPMEPSSRRSPFLLPLEAKLGLGGLTGLAAGVVLCLLVAAVAGERPDAISLAIFGFLGTLIGAIVGMTGE